MDQPQKRNGRAPRWDNPFPSENDSQSESASGRIVDHNPSERSSHLKSSHLNLLSSVDSEELSQNADDQLTPENMSLLLKAIQKRKMAHQAASSPRSTEKETLCGAGGHGPTVKKKVIDYGHKSKYEGPKGNARSSTIAVDDSVEKFQTRQAASVPAVPAVLISRPKNTSEELIRQVEPRARTPNPQAVPLVDPASKTPGLFPPPAGPRVPAAVPAVMLPVVPPMTLVPPVAQPVVQPAVDQPRVPSAPPLLEIESTNDKYLQAPWADPPNRTGQTTGGQKNAQKEPQDRFESPFGVVKASWLPVFSNTDAQKTRELPDPSQMNDYYAVTPRVFPRICSLCNEVCKDKVDWIQHQNSVVHIGNCQKLRVQYPNWHPEVSSPSKRCKGDGEERHTSRRRCASPSPKRSRCSSSSHYRHGTQSPSRSSGHTRCRTRSRSRSSGYTRRRTRSRSRSSGHTRRRSRSRSRSSGHTKHQTQSPSRSSGHTRRQTRSRSRSCGHTKHQTQSPSRNSGRTKHQTRSPSRSSGHTKHRTRSRSRSSGHTKHQTRSPSRNSGRTKHQTWSPLRSSDYTRHRTRSRSRSPGSHRQSRPRSRSPWRFPSPRPRSMSPWRPLDSSRCSCTSSSLERELENSRRSPERQHTWTPHSENRYDERKRTHSSSNYQEKRREDLEWTREGSPRQKLFIGTGRQEQERSRLVPRERRRDDPEPSALASLTEKSVLQAMAQLQAQGGAGRRLHRGRDSTHLAAGRTDTPAVPSDLVSMIQLVTTQVIEAVWDSKEASSRRPSASEDGRSRQQGYSAARKAKNPSMASSSLQQATSTSSNVVVPDTHQGNAKSIKGKTKKEGSPCPKKDISQSDTAKDKHVAGRCPKKESSSSGKAKDKNVADLCPEKESSSSGKAKDKNVASLCPKKESSSSGKAKDKNVAGLCPKKESSSSGKAKDKNVPGLCPRKDSSSSGKAKDKNVVGLCPEKDSSSSGKAKDKNVASMCPEKESSSSGKAKDKNVVGLCPEKESSSNGKAKDKNVVSMCPEKESSSSGKAKDKNVASLCPRKDSSSSGKAKDKNVAGLCPEKDSSSSGKAKDKNVAGLCPKKDTSLKGKVKKKRVVDPCPQQGTAVSGEAEKQPIEAHSPHHGTADNGKAENQCVVDACTHQGITASMEEENQHVLDQWPPQDIAPSDKAASENAIGPSSQQDTIASSKTEDLHVAAPSPQEDTSVSSEAENPGAASPSLNEGTAGNATAENLHVASPSPNEATAVSAETESKCLVALSSQEGSDLSSKAGSQETEQELVPGAATGTGHHLGSPGRVSKPRVQICGDSLVVSAQKRASLTTEGWQLGLEESLVLEWHGQEEMTWTWLLPLFQNLAAQGQAPNALILHLGGNDLVPAFDSSSFSTVKRAFSLLRELLPQVRVIWSEVIPQGIWHGGERDRQRKKLNTDVGKCVKSHGGAVIKHPRISSEDTELYMDKANLSDAGIDIFLEDIKNGILAHVLQSSGVAGGGLKKGTNLAPLAPSVTSSGLVSVNEKVAIQEEGAVSSSEEVLRTRTGAREGAASSQLVSGKARNSGVASPGPHPGTSGSHEVKNQEPRAEQHLEVASVPASSAVPADLPSVSQEAATGEDEAVSSSEEASDTQANQGEGAVNSQPVSSRAENSGAASPSPKAGVSGRSKAENQDEEQELVVGNVPPCSGNPGQASKLRVWICGQSVIISAQKQASSTTAGSQLGLETILLEWHGQEEMAWPQLVPALQKLAAQGQAPDGLIVHLGENDLLCSRGGQLSCTIKQELGLVKELFPQVRILWSNLLLRRRGFGKCGSRTVNRARGMVNLEVGQFIGSLGGAVIEHPAILHTVPDFYADGDSLSCDGLDIFLQDIKNGILAHFPS